MKELKIILLAVALVFGTTVPATTKFPNTYYPNTIKGGLQTSQKSESAKLAGMGVEGNYEYYMQYIKYQLNYRKSEEKEDLAKSPISPSCILAVSSSESC